MCVLTYISVDVKVWFTETMPYQLYKSLSFARYAQSEVSPKSTYSYVSIIIIVIGELDNAPYVAYVSYS